MTYFAYFAIYAAIFEVLYGIVAVVLLVLPAVLMAIAGADPDSSDEARRVVMMLILVPWKGGALWSAARATRRPPGPCP